jgi:dihydroorotase
MILIQRGRLIDPKSHRDEVTDILIENDRIKQIGKIDDVSGVEKIINANGKIVAPGFVDVHVHFRDPGFTYKEDIESGSAAAARGGYTTVVCMANTNPVIDNIDTLLEFMHKAKDACINVHTVAAVTKGLKGNELTDMKMLHQCGVVGFSDDGVPLMNTKILLAAIGIAATLDVPISLHEEDPSLINMAGFNDGVQVDEYEFLFGAPDISETSMIARDCMIALSHHVKVHIQHVSCAESVMVISLAKKLGANITAEVTPQHLTLTEDAVAKYGALAKLNPPFRCERDRKMLIAGLKNGTIDMIATDHAPHSAEEKSKSLTEAPSGMIGLETALGLMITHLVKAGHLSLMQLIEKMSFAPAKLYQFDAGYIAENGPADITIFDENENWTVEKFYSKSSNSPFIGEKLFGKVHYTICRGEIVYSYVKEKADGQSNI